MPFQKVSFDTCTVVLELPDTGPVWNVKSLRAIVVGGYALTMAEVTMPKLPSHFNQLSDGERNESKLTRSASSDSPE